MENTLSISQAVGEAALHASNAELRRQNEILCQQVREMRAFIGTFPGQLAEATRRGKLGKCAVYDYAKAARVTEFRIA